MNPNGQPELSKGELQDYLERWQEVRRQLYRQLLATYTPEQQKIVHQMNQATRQASLCRDRLGPKRTPANRTLAWPQEPPDGP